MFWTVATARMVKKELTVRERRRIYEDTIYVVAQTQKIEATAASKERSIRNMIDKQTNKCVSILTTVLGYHETVVVDASGTKTTMLIPGDEDKAYAIEKDKFDALVQKLPNDKELREALWRSFVKRDQKATAWLNAMVA